MPRRSVPVLDSSLGRSAAARPGASRRGLAPEPRLAEFAAEAVTLPSFHVWTLGCQMNLSDSEEMAGALLAAGCTEAPSLETADLIVINSCSVREAAEQKIIGRRGHLDRLKASNPALRVVLTGCGVHGDDRRRLERRFPAVDLFLRPDEEPELTVRLGISGPTAPGRLQAPEVGTQSIAGNLPGSRAAAVSLGRIARRRPAQAWIPIVYGCDKTCTYCIVPIARGPERSRPFDDVIAEARSVAASGYEEVMLLGQNVNSYGHDLPAEVRFADAAEARRIGPRIDREGRPDITALLRAIDGIRGPDGQPAISRLRFITSHPWDLSDRLVRAMAECVSVCEHLHLPVQAGSDAVLRRMGRQYTVDSYLGLVARLREAIPGIGLTTDVIVGFSGESEGQFRETLALLERVRFDTVYAAAYSPRPGTPAAALPDDVPPDVKRARLNELLALQEGIGLERNRAWVGRETEVFVEAAREPRPHERAHAAASSTPGTAVDDAGGAHGTGSTDATGRNGRRTRLTGRTRDYRLVHLDGGTELTGRRVVVRIDRAGPFALSGTLLHVVTGPGSGRGSAASADGSAASADGKRTSADGKRT
jgi:tRNA-2-methylthio-N6-dimethylallyladenosine synthase